MFLFWWYNESSDISFNETLLNEKLHKKTLIYDVSYKIFMGKKPLRIRFAKINWFIKVYNEIKYLIIFYYWLYDEFYHVSML